MKQKHADFIQKKRAEQSDKFRRGLISDKKMAEVVNKKIVDIKEVK